MRSQERAQMDGQRFDAFFRTFGRTCSRRQAVRAGTGGLLALLGVRAAGGQSESDCLDAPCQGDSSDKVCVTACGNFCCTFNQICDCSSIMPPDHPAAANSCVCMCPYPFQETHDGACVCPAGQRCGPLCCAPGEECCAAGEDSYCYVEGQVRIEPICIADYRLIESEPPDDNSR
jgi:hypothetical protein